MKQIYESLESTSFDTPDSWEKELRTRRVSLGNGKELVVQGSLQRDWQLPNPVQFRWRVDQSVQR